MEEKVFTVKDVKEPYKIMQWEYDSLSQKLIEIYINNKHDTTRMTFYSLDDSKNLLEELQLGFKKKKLFGTNNYGERIFKSYEFSIDTSHSIFGYNDQNRFIYIRKDGSDEKTMSISYEFDTINKIERRKITHPNGFFKGRKVEFVFKYEEEKRLKTDSYSQKDSIEQHSKFEYNKKRQLLKSTSYRNGKIFETYRYEYLNDERGNTIRKKWFYQKGDELEKLKATQNRTIIYWD